MALRLTRLQKEIHDKNEEIRRLQAEIVAESDETSILKQRMEEVQRKVKQLEKNNTELRQRLRDSKSPDHSGLSANAELTKLRKQLKKLQDEYEATTQRYLKPILAGDFSSSTYFIVTCFSFLNICRSFFIQKSCRFKIIKQ